MKMMCLINDIQVLYSNAGMYISTVNETWHYDMSLTVMYNQFNPSTIRLILNDVE